MNKIPWFDMSDPAIIAYLDDSDNSMVNMLIKRAKRKIKKQEKIHGGSLLKEGLEKFGLMEKGSPSESAFRKLLSCKRSELFSDRRYMNYSQKHSRGIRKYNSKKEGFGYLFDYDTLIKDFKFNGKNGRAELLRSSRTVICPYCDRAYITYYINDKNNKYTGQLDHFYPKSQYPLFALSLFNFVPSCASCNQTKTDGSTDILYPYSEDSEGIMSFHAKPNGRDGTEEYAQNLIDLWLGRRKANINIEIEVDDTSEQGKRMRNNINVFSLKEMYQAHSGIVNEMYLRNRIYNDGNFLKTACDLSVRLGLPLITEEELEAFLYGYQLNGFAFAHDRPLSKLTNDILREIKSINRTT